MSPTGGGVALYIAGSSSAVPRPGRANSGYLLDAGGCKIAVDFGSGVLSRLRERFEPTQLDAILVSHMHADHFFDLVPLRYALRYEMQRSQPLPVYLPPGGTQVLFTIAKPFRERGDFFDGVLDLREYTPEHALQVGACTVHFAHTAHYIPAYAMRIEAGETVFGYSADTAPCSAVVDLVRDTDLFLCEAALGADGSERGKRGHLNAHEAGEIAAAAAVKRLVLTHYGAKAEPRALREAAAKAFAGDIEIADDGMDFCF